MTNKDEGSRPPWDAPDRRYSSFVIRHSSFPTARIDQHQALVILDGIAVADQDLGHDAAIVAGDLVHHLHRLDDPDDLAALDAVADLDEGLRAGRAGVVEDADERGD